MPKNLICFRTAGAVPICVEIQTDQEPLTDDQALAKLKHAICSWALDRKLTFTRFFAPDLAYFWSIDDRARMRQHMAAQGIVGFDFTSPTRQARTYRADIDLLDLPAGVLPT